MFAGFGDFAFYRMEIGARIWSPASAASSTSSRQDVLTESSDAEALIEAEAEHRAHECRPRRGLRLYATKLLGAPDGEWRCVGCDPEGLELQLGRDACGCRSRSASPGRARCAQC